MSKKKSKSAKCVWTEDDTRKLLAAYSEQYHLFDGTVRDAELYKKLQHFLAAKGIVRQVQQIKDKIKLLKKSYKLADDSSPYYEEMNRIFGSKDSTNPKIIYLGLKKESCAAEQEIPNGELEEDPVFYCTTTLSPSSPLQETSPAETPLERNSPSRDEAGPSSSGPSAHWLKRKYRSNASVHSAKALSAATLSRKTVVERETLQRMAHARKEYEARMKEHDMRMAVMEEKILMLRAKRAYYERANKN